MKIIMMSALLLTAIGSIAQEAKNQEETKTVGKNRIGLSILPATSFLSFGDRTGLIATLRFDHQLKNDRYKFILESVSWTGSLRQKAYTHQDFLLPGPSYDIYYIQEGVRSNWLSSVI